MAALILPVKHPQLQSRLLLTAIGLTINTTHVGIRLDNHAF
jgi:hypothetical protein